MGKVRSFVMIEVYLPNNYLDDFNIVENDDGSITISNIENPKDVRSFNVISKTKKGMWLEPVERSLQCQK